MHAGPPSVNSYINYVGNLMDHRSGYPPRRIQRIQRSSHNGIPTYTLSYIHHALYCIHAYPIVAGNIAIQYSGIPYGMYVAYYMTGARNPPRGAFWRSDRRWPYVYFV